MKTFFLLVFCLFVSISRADFISAQKNYNNGDFEKAYNEYLILAKFGNNKAQYNLAVMFVKGQGVGIDLVQAYAWSKVSESNPAYEKLTKTIGGNLSKDQIIKATDLYQEYFKKYSLQNSKVLLGPIYQNNPDGSPIVKAYDDIIMDSTTAPQYPRKMAMNKIQGWVDLRFRIYPDGSVRDISIIEEQPKGGFTKEAIKAIETYRFSFEKDGEKFTIKEPRVATQRIDFKLRGYSTELNDKQQNYLVSLINKANNGDINAQYSYAYLYDTYLHKKGKIEAKQVNQWLYNAAIDGITGAQYRLGMNIYFGESCKVEKQKGLDWIMQAAQIGNAGAQYMAYNMLNNKTVINQSKQPASYWLEQAALNESNIAQLIYAKMITLNQSPSQEQLALATQYLSNYGKKVYKTIQWYQINAMLYNKKNKHLKALSAINKAIKKAKKVGWDLTELQQQKNMILNNKA